ncbi:MAG: YicC family protein [Flavobacteriales bacterium]|nr:YicC family protein [Flavobacteriales bacterium]
MMQSMTGFGSAKFIASKNIYNVEIRSLNSKFIDLNIKIPSVLKEKEFAIRKLLSGKLLRGKIEIIIWRDKSDDRPSYEINTKVIKMYHEGVLKLKRDLNLKKDATSKSDYRLNQSEIIPTLLSLPESLVKSESKMINIWTLAEQSIYEAADKLILYRKKEGGSIGEDIVNRINFLIKLTKSIEPLAKKRLKKINLSLNKKLSQLQDVNIDENRYEQELIYYLEKLDITEEIVRLKSHLSFFIESTQNTNPIGKKLGFICQEIGREINTLGSKASDSKMQKIIIQMKDELEKIKEQSLNIL